MIQFLVILMLIFAPIARGAVRMWSFAPIQILTLIILLFWVFKLFSNTQMSIRRTPLDIPIALFLFFSLIAFFNSRYIYGSILEFTRLITLIVIFYIVINFIDTREKIKRLLNVILMVSTTIALFGILQYLGIVDKSWWGNPKFLSATYVNHNHFAGLIELSIPLSIGMFLSEKELGKKSLYIYSFLILSIAFLLSMSRGGWFSLSVGMIFMSVIMLKKGKAKPILFISMLFLVSFGLLIFRAIDVNLLFKRIASYGELDFSGRSQIWKGTLGIIKDNWLLGTGPGTFIYNFPRYRPIGMNVFANYAHSDYLQVASEMGIFGLGLMVFIIGGIIKKALRTYKIAHSSFKTWISLSLATGILSMAIHGIGDFNFYIPANAILFTVFSALIFNISSRKEKAYPRLVIKPSPIVRRVFKPFALVAVTILIIFISASLAAEICSTVSTRAVSSNQLEKAERMARTAARICPFNHTYPYKLADIYNRKSQTEKSEKFYKEALHLNPMDAWSWIGLADSYYVLSKNSSIDNDSIGLARASYKKALDLDPVNSYYLKKYARFLLDIGDADLSSQIYKKASYVMSRSETLSPMPVSFTDAESYEEIADLAFFAQDIDKALTFYKMAEGFNRESEGAKLGQVRCYLKMFLLSKALDKFEEIGSTRKNRSILFACLADYYLRKDLISTAKRFAERSIILDSENPEGFQARYKIAKTLNRNIYHIRNISEILAFNALPVSRYFNPDGLGIRFGTAGDLHKGGSLVFELILPAGTYELNVTARGKEAVNVRPHMAIRFNDNNSMDSYVDAGWKDYPCIVSVDYPVNRLEIVFDNDYYDPEKKQDRNLYIDGITLKDLR